MCLEKKIKTTESICRGYKKYVPDIERRMKKGRPKIKAVNVKAKKENP